MTKQMSHIHCFHFVCLSSQFLTVCPLFPISLLSRRIDHHLLTMRLLLLLHLIFIFCRTSHTFSLSQSIPVTSRQRLTTLSEIQSQVNQQTLTENDKLNIINNAANVLEGFNPHRFIHLNKLHFDPAAHLRDLIPTMNKFSNFEFHRKVKKIFSRMNDFHTLYQPPEPLRSSVAALGFSVSSYYKPGKRIPTYFIPGTNFTVLRVDGVPVDQYVLTLGMKGFGSNIASRRSNGLVALTIRSIDRDPIPTNETTLLLLTDDVKKYTLQAEWFYVTIASNNSSNSTSESGKSRNTSSIAISKAPHDTGVELYNIQLFKQFGPSVKMTSSPTIKDIPVPKLARDFYSAKEIKTSFGTFGYIKILTFDPDVPTGTNEISFLLYLLQEFANTLFTMNYTNMVIDIADNPGGAVFVAKYVFEYFTHLNVPPIPVVSRATNLTLSMYSSTKSSSETSRMYHAAVQESLEIGEQFTGPVAYLFNSSNIYDAFMTSPRAPQLFFGNFVLVVNAQSYSAADLFASWVRDTKAGLVIGLNSATGGGGATVSKFSTLQNNFPNAFPNTLPQDIDFTTADIRIFRNGRVSGTLLENSGVQPNKRYFQTYKDVVHGNIDFYNYIAQQF